jgi:hypothetical protein
MVSSTAKRFQSFSTRAFSVSSCDFRRMIAVGFGVRNEGGAPVVGPITDAYAD